MDDYKNSQKPSELLEKMQRVFEERDAEYQKRNEEFQNRQSLLDSLESKISQQKEDVDAKRVALEEKEATLETQINSVNRREAQNKQRASELDEEKAKIEQMKQDLILEQKLTLEDLKTQKMAAEREYNELQREKSMIKNGVNPDVDLNRYIRKEFVEMDYILRSELKSKYLPHKEHDEIVANLKAQLSNALREKTELFRKMISASKEQQTPEIKEGNDPVGIKKDNGEEDTEHNSASSELEHMEVKDETKEELNAEVLYRYLQKNAHGLSDIEIYHAMDGDQIKAQSGRISYRFVFDAPCYFDLSVDRKENRKTKQVIEELNHSAKYSEVKFKYQDGKVWVTGYFTSDATPYKLMSYVENLTKDCFDA